MRWTVKARLFALCGTATVLALAVGYVGQRGGAAVSEAADKVSVTLQAIRNQMEADMMHDALHSDVLSALLAEDAAALARTATDVAEHAAHFRAQIAANDELELTTEATTAIAAVKPALESYISAAERIVAEAGKSRDAAKAKMPSFIEQFESLEGRMSELSDVIEKSTEAAETGRATALASTTVWTWSITVVGASAIGVFGLMTVRSITRRLSATNRVLAEVARGDLRQRVDEEQEDELGELARSCNAMTGAMSELVSRLARSATEVSEAADRIGATSRELDDGLRRQEREVENASGSVQELLSSAEQVTGSSAVAAKAADASGGRAEEGGAVVAETIQDMRAINEAVEQSTASVTQLGRRGEQIGQIVAVINDIADQTNLLALNAAIEAARAGEHGRGFAVVADEVRKLADRTTKATEEISTSIKQIQTETTQAVERMNTGNERVRSGAERAGRAGTSLGEIVSAAKNVATQIRAIASAADQQSAASRRIQENVDAIADVTKAATQIAAGSASAAADLATRSLHLRELVSGFRIDEKASATKPKTPAEPASASMRTAVATQEQGAMASSDVARVGAGTRPASQRKNRSVMG
jgi:methyl-accepting chemotaxis protein